MIHEGDVLWTPTEADKAGANVARFIRWLERTRGLRLADYADVWRWSVSDIDAFWTAVRDYFGVTFRTDAARALGRRDMPGASWFEGARLNYAENVFRQATDRHPAVIFRSETADRVAGTRAALRETSWEQLARGVASVAATLRQMGVQPGDRVAAYAPNMPETLIAFLACASIGAVWSSCSPDLGAQSVHDRLSQIEPVVLFAIDGYVYGGKEFDRRGTVRDLVARLPTLRHVVHMPYLRLDLQDVGIPAVSWDDATASHAAELAFEPVPFEHPLWVLYSSGTTGLPKPIVHGHGGIVLEHMKALAFHSDLKPGDRFFWFTTTGWMMWNLLIGGLLVGATAVMYDGSPGYPDMGALWQLAHDARVTLFGASAAYVTGCMKSGIAPNTAYDLSSLRCFGSTGSPLSVEGFAWLYERVKPDLWLASISGGTDVCTAFVGSCPLLPVRAGELQCRCLGADVQAWDTAGHPVVGEVGELVIAQPLPSMPVFFWNDPDMRRYRESYFDMFPGAWRHGDWIKFTSEGSAVIYGRSDATINRQGVRIGTAEIYRAVEDVPEVADSLVVDLEMLGRASYMPLFVVLIPGARLDEELKDRIRKSIRARLSARQVPDDIFAIPEIPKTLNGKKMEVPVKRILLGHSPDKAANLGSMSNPGSLDFFVDLARRLG